MLFKKIRAGKYQATRKDKQIVTIEKQLFNANYGDKYLWFISYADYSMGDMEGTAETLKRAIALENKIENQLN